jgi:hypothetical protein
MTPTVLASRPESWLWLSNSGIGKLAHGEYSMTDHRKRGPPRIGETYSSRVLRDSFGFTSENRLEIRVDRNDVPEKLKPLIKDVERWAIPCDVTRADYFRRQSEEEVDAFWNRVNPYVPLVNSWLDTLGDDVQRWPTAATQFLDLLMAHQDAWRPTEEERVVLVARRATQSRRIDFKRALNRATDLFSQKEYEEVVKALEPYEDELDQIAAAKLAFSRRKAGESRK